MRKCNNTAALNTADCETPAPLPSKLGARQTPQSARGSSSFSPGEAFWNEAILVADGMVNNNAGLSSHVAENNNVMELDYGVMGSVCNAVAGSAVGPVGMHVKDMDKEVSPLPVKHFDFSFEAKSLEKEITADANNTKPDILAIKETAASIISSSKDQIGEILPGEKSLKCTVSRSVKELQENSHDIVWNTPNRDNEKVVADEPKSNCTPASSSINGGLDLSNWLPPEICHIYYKKGIPKLYPWQVTLPLLGCLGQLFESVHWSYMKLGKCTHFLHVIFQRLYFQNQIEDF